MSDTDAPFEADTAPVPKQGLQIDIYAELKKLNIDFKYTSDTWLSILCPFHDDSSPSCGVNTVDFHYNCKACGAHGSFEKLGAHVTKVSQFAYHEYLKGKYGAGKNDKPVEIVVVEDCHSRLWEAYPLLAELRKRGVSDDMLREHRLGEKQGRVTIPILSENDVYVNLISYSPGAKKNKFLNLGDRGKPIRAYPSNQMQYKRKLIVGGMVKALAAIPECNRNNVGVLTCTGGEGAKAWPPELIDRVVSETEEVYICLDIDVHGKREAELLALRFYRHCKVHIIELPLDLDKYPKGDINDWIGIEHQPVLPLLQRAVEWKPAFLPPVKSKGEPETVSIHAAAKADNANKRLRFRGLITAIEPEAYYLPKDVRVTCNRNQPFCPNCPIYTMPDAPTVKIDAESEALLEMIGAKQSVQNDAIRKSVGIPPCKVVDFDTLNFYHAQYAILGQDLDSRSADSEVTIHAVSIDCKLEINETYDVIGRIIPHPNTQRATALVSDHATVVDTLTDYNLNAEPLYRFQPEVWTSAGVFRKLESIYDEFSVMVTHIDERQDLHLLYDLCWHSVLALKVGGRVRRGYVEVLAVGDTAQGKSDTAEMLQRHYGLGTITSLENASVAGLLGVSKMMGADDGCPGAYFQPMTGG